MDDDEIYSDAVFGNITMFCDHCSAYRDEFHPTELEIKYPDEGWIEALINVLRSEGWSITRTAGGSYFDFKILCPACGKQVST